MALTQILPVWPQPPQGVASAAFPCARDVLARPDATPPLMACRVTITMPDGSTGEHHGLYTNPLAACARATALFPTARHIYARPMPRAARRLA